MIDPERTYDALARLKRFGKPATIAALDEEMNEAVPRLKALGVKAERVDVKRSLDVLKSRGQAEESGGVWRLRAVEETGERLLF